MSAPRTKKFQDGICSPDGRSLSRTRGSIILIVLITVMLAVLALTAFIDKASTDLLVESREANAVRLRLDAYSALETTLAVLEDFRATNGALRSPAEGWSDPLGFAGYTPRDGVKVEISFEDESAKISLPNITAAQLVDLFKTWQLNQSDSEKLSDSLMGWMNRDYVPTSGSSPRAEDYERADIPFVPPGRPLRSFAELASINVAREMFYDDKGAPTDLFQRFVSAFSLYQFKSPNVNGGNSDVISSLGITDQVALKRMREYLSGTGTYEHQGPGYFKSSSDVATLLGMQSGSAPQIATEISALRIIVTVRESRLAYRMNLVVAPQGGATVPPSAPVAPTANTNPSAASPASTTPPPPSPSTNPSANSTDPSAAAPKLNYPYTILEIRENDEIPSAPAVAGI